MSRSWRATKWSTAVSRRLSGKGFEPFGVHSDAALQIPFSFGQPSKRGPILVLPQGNWVKGPTPRALQRVPWLLTFQVSKGKPGTFPKIVL